MAPSVELELPELASALLDVVDPGDSKLADLLDDPPHVPLASGAMEALERDGQAVVDGLGGQPLAQRRVAESMTNDLIEYLFEEYPFIEIDAGGERALIALHARLVGELVERLARAGLGQDAEAELLAARAAHFDRLRRLVTELLGPDQRRAIRASAPRVVSSDYSPPLQLRVFDVDEADLRDPILDLGCGRLGLLVEWLRRRHHQVAGIDRVADPDGDCLRASWFEVSLEPARYGTIFSHLAFSLHFLHAHLRPGPAAERFARKYMEILRALRPGGTFYYAPGLPFIEPHLDPRRHEVRRNPVPESQLLDMPEPLRAVYRSGGSEESEESEGMYASAVRRLY